MTKNILRLVTDDAAPSRLLAEYSPARLHLAKLIDQRLRVEDNLRQLADAAARLREAQDAEGNAAAALNALDAEEARAMAAWSQNSSGAMPVFDRTRREKLRENLEAATAQATAARRATADNAAQQQRENAKLKPIEDEIDLTIATVIAEEVEPLIAEFTEFNRELAAKAGRIAEASEVINLIGARIGQLASARPNAEAARPLFTMLEKLNEKIRLAFSRPAPDVTNHRAAWQSFAAALRRDPIAELKD